MEFPFDINLLIENEISVFDRTLKPFSAANAGQRKSELCKVIDDMGRASAQAQGLRATITSASRLLEGRHVLYLMKDDTGSSRGRAAVVGLLKIGNKKLFVYDQLGVQHELEPMCVLDFYVHESCQRRGYGRKLFDEMLRREGVEIRRIAIDRPSPKFLSFLRKHYNLKAIIPQVNNFVIFEGFFNDKNESSDSNVKHPKVDSQNKILIEPISRAAEDVQRKYTHEGRSTPFGRPSSGKINRCMAAQQVSYSRHSATPPPLDLCKAASGDSLSPVAPNPPLLRRDGPSRDYLRLINENNNSSYIGRRGGNLMAPTTTSSQPSQGQNIHPSLGAVKSLGSAWNVLGVPPRTLPNSVTSGSVLTTVAGTNQKYRRTNLW